MEERTLSEPIADPAEVLELGIALGHTNAFAMVAGRCSAAQAQGMRRIREQKLYKGCTEKWEDFCPRYLKMSRAEADRIIRLLEEFGPTYFELSQITRVSPETYRAIAPNIRNGVLHHNGEAIELNVENSRKIAAAVTELRNAIPKNPPEMQRIIQELNDIGHELSVEARIGKLAKCCASIVAEFEKLSRDDRLGITRGYLQTTIIRVRDEMIRLAGEDSL
ncbi:MAG TPA: hypothetical protein VKV17_22685 [Bryobacteraceae bacterium]|nr:hypothetical protein [Bryobacteraceae bacterium]